MRSKLLRILAVAGVLTVVLAMIIRPRAKTPEAGRLPELTLNRTREGLLLVNAPLLREVVVRAGAHAVLVNVWASWCGACKEDLPMLVGLRAQFAPRSLAVLLVSVDGDDGLPAAVEMLMALHAPSPSFVVKGSLETFKKELNPRWAGMIPATFLFDEKAKLHYFWGGPVFENDVVPILKRYLAGENVDGEANFALAPGATDPEASKTQ